MSKPLFHRLQLLFICLVLGICSHLLFSFMVRLIDEAHYARQRLEVANQLGGIRLLLEQQLNSTFYVSRALEMLVEGLTADGSQLTDHWGQVKLWAAEATEDIPTLINIGLSDQYVVKFTYPLERNANVFGMDYRTLPEQWPAVQRAVRTRLPVVAGPLELIQGGMGVICRIPLFSHRLSGSGDEFIGIVGMVIDYNELLKVVGLTEAEKDLTIAIKGRDGLGETGGLFYGNERVFEQDGVKQTIEFLGGEWVIAAKPVTGWAYESPYSQGLNVLGYVIAVAGAVMLYLAVQGVRHRAQEARQFTQVLEARVEERTRELQLAKEQAESANRAKSEFLAVVTHELRTPLNSIIGLTDFLFSMELGTKQRQYLGKISTSAGLLLDLINNILSYAKMESGKEEVNPVPFSLVRLLDKVTDLFGVAADDKGLAFHVELTAGTPAHVRGDEAKILQVLVNLCGNALKFTRHGEIRVSVTAQESRDKTADVLCYRFVVSDSGIGIDPGNRQLLFRPFSQVDSSKARRYQGSGLGLSICKSFVDLMGGQIGVDSTIGEGSRFWFEIPLPVLPAVTGAASDQPPMEELDWVEQARGKLAGITLVLAEDNEFNQTLAVALLNKVGINVELAVNGLEVLDLLQRQPVHGILMDIQMPEMDGVTATVNIRKNPRYADLPIIALTANAMDEDRQQVMAAGVDQFIAKPIRPEQFYRTLYETFDKGKSF